MDKQIEWNLAKSLTADDVGLIPYLPYLLQDFWELGSSPEEILALIQSGCEGEIGSALDLACGKGAVSVKLAKALGCTVKAIDILPPFIEYACQKAQEYAVEELCTFRVGDVGQAVREETGYDCVIWGAAGNLLGDYRETLEKVASTARPGGYLLVDDAYVETVADNQALQFGHTYPTYAQWMELFGQTALRMIRYTDSRDERQEEDYRDDLEAICRRAEELSARHPEKRELFEAYCRSQQAEYADLQDRAIGVLWLLQKQ